LVFVAQSTFEIAEERRLTICQWAWCIIYEVYCSVPISVAVRFKAWVWGHSHDRTAGSNHAAGMDVRLLWVLRVVRKRSLRRALHSSWRVPPSVMCLTERDLETSTRRSRRPASDTEPRKRNCSLFQITC
jgi:hypothetical protein